MNPHKDMNLWKIWITKVEELSILESIKILQKESTSKLNGYAMSNITEIIQNAYERGDLIK